MCAFTISRHPYKHITCVWLDMYTYTKHTYISIFYSVHACNPCILLCSWLHSWPVPEFKCDNHAMILYFWNLFASLFVAHIYQIPILHVTQQHEHWQFLRRPWEHRQPQVAWLNLTRETLLWWIATWGWRRQIQWKQLPPKLRMDLVVASHPPVVLIRKE